MKRDPHRMGAGLLLSCRSLLLFALLASLATSCAMPRPAGLDPATGLAPTLAPLPPADDGKLRIIAFGAHPDDCEIKAGGTAALWAKAGHHVRFVSVTNGDIGHWREAGGPLAQRRRAEVEKAAKLLAIETVILDIHDGELMPTLENRRKITRLIRDWQADVVLAPRPNDYHPDHRYTGVLVQDAAYMVTVPFFCPDTPHLTKNPVFLYYEDRFERPNAFRPDVVVPIDPVLDAKLAALVGMESQFCEGGANGNASLMPADEVGKAARRKEVSDAFESRFASTVERCRAKLEETLGKDSAARVKAAEAFELCEYGSQPKAEELRALFP